MGNANKSQQSLSTYIHPNLGVISLNTPLESCQNPVFTYNLILQNSLIYNEWQKQMTKLKNHPQIGQILFLPIHSKYKQTSYCGTGGQASLIFEDYLYTLHPQIINRGDIKRPFSQPQIMYLFYNLIKLEKIMADFNQTIGDVKPQNIFVNEEGYFKILGRNSFPGQNDRLVACFEGNNERVLLAPEECDYGNKSSRKKEMALGINRDSNTSQTFSIGMTILQAGTLKNVLNIYGDPLRINSITDYKFNEYKLREYLQIFSTRYSKELTFLLKQTLRSSSKRRSSVSFIYDTLKPYEDQIIAMEQFQIQGIDLENVPRVERQEKMSIKKLNQSNGQFNVNSETAKFSQLQQSDLRQSLQTSELRQSIQQPSINQSIQQPSVNYSPYNQYNIVSENTNYPNRQSNIHLGQQFPTVVQHKPPPPFVQSMPPNLIAEYNNQRNQYVPQYVTQNSMYVMNNSGVRQSAIKKAFHQ